MFALLRARGIDPRQCDAWVYGGGNMFPDQFQEPHVGQRNVWSVLDELGQRNVRVLRQDVGGSSYRRLAWTVGPQEPRVAAVPV
jgi:chemotaxis protein CheD